MKKPKLKKYPVGGNKGFIPNTMVHYLGAGEVPYSKDQLGSMGYNYEATTGGFDEYSMGNNRRFYKTVSPGTPEWNNPDNPYLTASTNAATPVVKPAPKLKWPTRTDYSKGSKGPIYDVPKFYNGGINEPVAPAAYDNTQINSSIDNVAGQATPWYGMAKGAANIGKSMITTDKYGNPTNTQDKQLNAVLTPHHEFMVNDVTQGNYGKAIAETLLPGIGYESQSNALGLKKPIDKMLGTTKTKGQFAQEQDQLALEQSQAFDQAVKDNMYHTYAQGGVHSPYTDPNVLKYNRTIEDMYPNLNQIPNYIDPNLLNYNKTIEDLKYKRTIEPLKFKRTIQDLPKGHYEEYSEGGIKNNNIIHAPELGGYFRKEYANGGLVYNNPNAAIEKKEVVRYPDGSTAQANHGTHESGNDAEVNLPDGTQIFSDRLKDPTTKKTFAKMAEKYKIKDTDDKANHLAKSSKELVDQMKQRKLDELFAKQEQLKQAKLNKYAQKLGLDPEAMFKNGGTKLPKFDGGGTWVNGVWVPNSTTKYGYSTPEGTFTADGTKTADSYGQPVGFDSPLPMITNQDLENRNTMEIRTAQDAAIPKIQDVNSITKPSTSRKMNADWIEPAANTLMQNAGNIAYLAEQGKKYDKQNFYKYTPELYNPADALRQADIEARVTRDRLKDATGGNAGALMSNLQQSQAMNTLLKSKIRTDAANQNANTLNDAQVRNIGSRYATDDINARNKGQALTNYYKTIQGIGMNTSAAYADWKRGNMDKNTANMIGSMFQNYGLDINNPNDWKIFYKKASNKE